MPPRKRAQFEFPMNASNGKIKVGKRSSRGGLTQLADMPLDIWFEVRVEQNRVVLSLIRV